MLKIKIKCLAEQRFITQIVFLLLVLFCLNESNSQNINFKHITINDGLSQNAVFAILQDSKGFMWFGTKDGLNRYDGYSFIVFQHNPFDSTTISANYITALFEDSRGYIWIGTLNGGLNCFDQDTEIFHHVLYGSIGSDNFNTDEIKSIAEDKAGYIWVATRSNGLFKININSKNFFTVDYKHYTHKEDKTGSLSSNFTSTLFFDSKGILWVGTENGLNKFNLNSESFAYFKIQTKNSKATSSPYDQSVSAVYESKDGTFWLGTLSGLVKFERGSGSYKLFPHEYEIDRYGWGNIIAIIEDQLGTLWLATPGELMRFDPTINSYTYFKNDPLNPKSISFSSISSLYTNKTGIVWIGTAGMGINLYDPKANRFSTLLKKQETLSRITGFSVRSILEENSDIVWISTAVLYRWNRKTGELKSYETTSDKLDDFGNTGIWTMIKSSDGKIWAATTEGLYKYDPVSEKARQYKFDPANNSGLPQKEVYSVFEDQQHNIWIATENYLSRLIDKDKGIFQHFRYQTELSSYEEVRTVFYQDPEGIFWIGTKNGLLRFDPLSNKIKSYRTNPAVSSSINNNLIKSLCADPAEPKKILWVGTAGGGLNRFNIEDETFTHFTEDSGLPNNVVYGILPDKHGNLWLSTNKGLSKFNPHDSTFRNYDVQDGLQSNEFNTGAYFCSKNGEMFFGGIKGLNYFFPDQIKDNPNKPNIVLTNFKIRDRYISNKIDTNILQKSISKTDHLVLSYDDDVITFEFAALDYSASEKNLYAYKLENFNEDWIYSGSVRFATYTNLPPGEYIFRVKGSNNDDVWNEKGTLLHLTITPPWWKTWWSYILYGLLFLSGLYLIRRYEMNRIHWKNQLKLEKVETDTLRKLDQLKSQFFANISHEFRTPLTLILGQVESVMSSSIEVKEKGKLQVANRNARRLLTLINQLLDLSKLESGSMELRANQHNIVSFLKSLFYSFESLAETQKITLKFDSELANIPVVFDPDKMEKVFYNLISNAFKFTKARGEIKVCVGIVKSSLVEIRINDTGEGIPADRLPHIFNRFYQADSSLTRGHEGTGIGLALTKELIELHKGFISVTSTEGEGSEFVIHLPLGDLNAVKEKLMDFDIGLSSKQNIFNDIETSEAEQESRKFSVDSQFSENGHKEIILIVEDNHDVRAYIHEQLENNYKLIEASNGEEGISIAQKEIPDLIITDVMMPKMDGYRFTKLIRSNELTSHVPIMMLTAKAALDDKIEGLETGIDAYLTKPFSTKELKATVKNLIYQRAQLRKRFSSATIIKPSEVSAVSVDQKFLEKTINIIEAHFEDEQFGVENLAEEVNMSVSQLNRKLNALVNQPAGQLIRSLRLQRAADLLKQNAGSVAEICYMLGFNDQAYFSRAFRKQFGYTPSDYKKQSEPKDEE